MMTPNRFDPKAMDDACHEAVNEITGDNVHHFAHVAAWWAKWYRRAGHKRLGRALLDYSRVKP